jgi:hypothetical protein
MPTTPAEALLIELAPTGFPIHLDEANDDKRTPTGRWARLSGGEKAIVSFALSLDGYGVMIDLEDCFARMDSVWRVRCAMAIADTWRTHPMTDDVVPPRQ